MNLIRIYIKKNMKKILVTGGNGFIGGYLIKKLTGFYDIHVLDVETDITNEENVRKKIYDVEPDVVFHFAGYIYSEDFLKAYRVNYLGTRNLILSLGDINRFIFMSTAAVYGNIDVPFKESDKIRPNTIYSWSKACAEQLCIDELLKGKPFTIVRGSLVYGPQQKANLFIPVALKSLYGCEMRISSNGEQTRDFLYIDDLCDALIMLIRSNVNGILNIGSGQEVELKKVIDLMERISDRKANVVYDPKQRENDVCRYYLDIDGVKSCLDWVPQMSLEDGLRKIIEYGK